MADLYEVLLVDEGQAWHAGWVADDETETDLLLREGGRIPVFASRAALEHHAQERGLNLQEDLPDEIDLELGGWLGRGEPVPPAAEVLELWHLLYDDPQVGKALSGDELAEAYDDLVEDDPDWFATHGTAARLALAEAVKRLRGLLDPG